MVAANASNSLKNFIFKKKIDAYIVLSGKIVTLHTKNRVDSYACSSDVFLK